MTKRFLVSGSRGFIGRWLQKALEDRGDVVEPLVRGPEPGTYLDASGRFDAFVHLAFPTDHAERLQNPEAALTEAEQGTTAAVEMAGRLGIRHVLLASSGKVYGAESSLPIAETSEVAPTTELGKLKAAAEGAAERGAKAHGLGVTSLRLFNVYGPGQAETFLIPKLVAAARSNASIELGELDHRRDWIYVDDAVQALLLALERAPPGGELRPLNVGTSKATSARELLVLVKSAAGRTVNFRVSSNLLRPTEGSEERADNSQLRSWGWSPRVTLQSGIVEMMR